MQSFSPPRPRTGLPKGKKSPLHVKTFTGETSLCPGCEEPVYFAEKVMSLGRNWHRPCLRCQRCRKTLTAGSHAEVSKEGMGCYVGRREARDRKRATLRGLSFSLCPSMMASPTATSPATATCLAPKVGSSALDAGPKVWHVGLWLCVDNFPCSWTYPRSFPLALTQYPLSQGPW
ncbi:cysteine-rich protein 3 isoform X5 [Sturnira hondurensis]|uniref:cysteine-rich protein 3 isoform X5 n=1 Tax=Sturnira hondurensis TaxID=192404 RepID=UPI001879963F|nr:cysteine-rich protein 3 isoform X5 [Sturnira hondurensis]